MADLPLLLFPTPEIADRTKRKVVSGKVNIPTASRQGERLSPLFRQLQNSFNERDIELQHTPVGIEPEQVLVIETVGSIEDFANAVKKIPGLEWMGEIEADEIAPDDDFYDEQNPNKKLNGRLYLIMTNQQALNQMLSLWGQYQNNTSMRFERGLTKFRDVFLHLKDIRHWNVEDRLAEREVFEIWKEEIEQNPNRNVRFEAELWYRGNEAKHNESETVVRQLINQLGGDVITQCTIPSIAYHSILGEIPAEIALQIIEQPEVELLKCDNVMFFRPTGQMATGRKPAEGDLSEHGEQEQDLPSGNPLIAILDGMPLENHKLLSGRLIVDDPDVWSSEYPSVDRQHGTAMASLIVHGDLNNGSFPLSRPVYVRPIMKPNPTDFNSPREECIPANILFVDYIHRAIRRMIEGEGEDDATAPTVKVINLSIGDLSRHFSQIMSPLARLVDWLSAKYNLLFIISSGNHLDSISMGISSNEFEALSEIEREELIVKKLYEDARHRKLLSPGESINGLTVGASHFDDASDFQIGFLINVFNSELPSPVSAFGSGYRRSIKPDLIFPGGRVLYNKSMQSNNVKLEILNRKIAPGNKVAAPSRQVGELHKSQFCCGSSNSAALISRSASICYEVLSTVIAEQAPDIDFSIFGIPILKAMLVHGCSWNELGTNLENILRTAQNGNQIRNLVSRWIGYGTPDIQKSLGCNAQRATLLGFGRLSDGEAHVYRLPLPPSLNAIREQRRFTVTLAWLSGILPTTQRYRQAQLWFDFEDGKQSRQKLSDKLKVKGIDSDSDATRRGTVQHEIFEGDRAVAITDGDILQIKVNCRKDACKIETPTPYGLVVSLEVAEGLDIPIYEEVRTRITPAIEIRARGEG